MTQLPPLRVAGVPEAYNEPFLLPEAKLWKPKSPVFTPYPGGSGSMLKAVIDGDVDAAFALTDCIVAAIENGSNVSLAGPLILTPLTWAVIVAPSGPKSVEGLSSATWGVSRLGSGSHVMVQTLAKKNAWPAPKFKVCQNFDGLRAAVVKGDINAFLWEHYTTKPYADSGEVRIIGGVPTPWGCFSVVVRSDCPRVADVHHMIDIFVTAGKKFVEDQTAAELITRKYKMSEVDANSWMLGVTYAHAGERHVSSQVLQLTRKTLHEAGVIKEYLRPGGIESYHV